MFNFTDEQKKRLLDFFNMTDFEFYERYLADLPLEEQAAFMEEFPEFLDDDKDVFDTNTDMFKWIMEEVGMK